MKKSPELTMKQAIDQMLKAYKAEDKMIALKIEEIWPELMGVTVSKLTVGFRFLKGKLTILLSSSVLRQELLMNQTLLIQNLNEKLGNDYIKEIEIK